MSTRYYKNWFRWFSLRYEILTCSWFVKYTDRSDKAFMASMSDRLIKRIASCRVSTALKNFLSDICFSSLSGTSCNCSLCGDVNTRLVATQDVFTHIELRICNISSYDWEVAARLLTSGLVIPKLLFAFISESLSRWMRCWEEFRLDWILWKVPIELLKPWWCSWIKSLVWS